jgi:hypothetical protein
MKTKGTESKLESSDPQCWIENSQAQILRVELEDGIFHLCPYAWLVWVQFSPRGEGDTLVLTFNSHTVSISGKNLRELALSLQRMVVESVKQPPKQSIMPFNNSFTSIETIQVESIENRRAEEGQTNV